MLVRNQDVFEKDFQSIKNKTLDCYDIISVGQCFDFKATIDIKCSQVNPEVIMAQSNVPTDTIAYEKIAKQYGQYIQNGDSPYFIDITQYGRQYHFEKYTSNTQNECNLFIQSIIDRLQYDLYNSFNTESYKLASILSKITGVSILAAPENRRLNLKYNEAYLEFLIHPAYVNYVRYVLSELQIYLYLKGVWFSIGEKQTHTDIGVMFYYFVDVHARSLRQSLTEELSSIAKEFEYIELMKSVRLPQVQRVLTAEFNPNNVILHDFNKISAVNYQYIIDSETIPFLGKSCPIVIANTECKDGAPVIHPENIAGELVITRHENGILYGSILKMPDGLIYEDGKYTYYALGMQSIGCASADGTFKCKSIFAFRNNLIDLLNTEKKDAAVS